MIGGSIWRISTALGEDVVYAVDYNHRKELHLNSTALAGLFSRPALMIADADRQARNAGAFFHTVEGRQLGHTQTHVCRACWVVAASYCIHTGSCNASNMLAARGTANLELKHRLT